MNDWYSIKKIHEKLYMISEDKHWEQTHMYYIIGNERNILVDTGTGLFGIKNICKSIDDKPIEVVITHGHWDHIGNIDEFDTVYCHPLDGEWLVKGIPLPEDYVRQMLIKEVDQKYIDHVVKPLKSPKIETYRTIRDKDEIEGYQILHTPGHSPGHIVLYDSKRKLLLCGDIVYEGTIYCHFESTNPQDLYRTYKTINKLDINQIYSGHFKVPLGKDTLEFLLDILDSLDQDKLLEHGNGLREKNKVAIVL